MADVGSLEEEAMKRKAKLKALKSKRGDKQEDVSIAILSIYSIRATTRDTTYETVYRSCVV